MKTEVISCRQIWKKSSAKYAAKILLNPQNWHFPFSLPVKCLLCFLIHSPTSTNIWIDILPKSYHIIPNGEGRREYNSYDMNFKHGSIFQKFWPREGPTPPWQNKWHWYFLCSAAIHLCHEGLSVHTVENVTTLWPISYSRWNKLAD